MNTFHLIVSSPDGNKFDGEVLKLVVRAAEGELAVMAGHIPFMTSVKSAPCTLHLADGTKKTANTKGGLLTVDADKVTFISGSFEFN